MVGLPGIVLAAMFLFLKEPARRPTTATDVIGGSGFFDALKYIWDNKLLYIGFVLIICTMTAIAYSQGFLAPTFERTWGWSPQKYAFINGVALLIIGPANMLIMGTI